MRIFPPCHNFHITRKRKFPQTFSIRRIIKKASFWGECGERGTDDNENDDKRAVFGVNFAAKGIERMIPV
jgi:hypothetical protein